MAGQTLYDKVWQEHEIEKRADGTSLVYIDRMIVHEVTSPQAFEGMRLKGRKVRNHHKLLAVADHNTPTFQIENITDREAKIQLDTLERNTRESGIEYYPLGHKYNGVCHVTAPERGFVLPGCTLVCGDSHTATHGAFGAIAFGIGTSEVEQVLATQSLLQRKMKNMRIRIDGQLSPYVRPKDVILYIIGRIGTAGATGYAIEFTGSVFENMNIAGRMTVCNMGIEAGARVAMFAPDEETFRFLQDRDMAPKGAAWDQARTFWLSLKTDDDAVFDRELQFDAADIEPQVTWGTSPEDVLNVNGSVPEAGNPTKQRALDYIGLIPGTKLTDVPIDRVFIGSCTNGRIEDIREAAEVLKQAKDNDLSPNQGKIAPNVKQALIVPGSMQVRLAAEQEGLDQIFLHAGFEWRMPGCSMCLAMNDDRLLPEERCASTSNRNFEGRQGRGGRTHLMSPAMVAAAALAGKITDVRQFL
ncbi:3-isopropylmalate dehydratase large subunit [Candidatus Haliotispira prima]|uniref:3-isopropylmalate dehydratase large subunit n=1 Tax=Candidatus Haliotispira prima TaxID=3034016 RepID=A0ABY8MKN3_9SPIO|nr:3-isopropylmalate dehydratase large subunit [Candidatus Haliotispira prima]